jgi:hypothetical protein
MPTDTSPARILKYTVPVELQGLGHIIELRGPILAVASRNHLEVHFWALDDPHNETCSWTFHVVGTGHPIPDGMCHVGTALDGPYVWHLVRNETGR